MSISLQMSSQLSQVNTGRLTQAPPLMDLLELLKNCLMVWLAMTEMLFPWLIALQDQSKWMPFLYRQPKLMLPLNSGSRLCHLQPLRTICSRFTEHQRRKSTSPSSINQAPKNSFALLLVIYQQLHLSLGSLALPRQTDKSMDGSTYHANTKAKRTWLDTSSILTT